MTNRGIVYTFYSYKGGVGRSMALANVAALLAKWRKRVLIVDWDLEAPGLEKYFSNPPSTLSASRANTPGLMDLIHAHIEGKELSWRDCLLKAYPFAQGSPVYILSAGQETANYTARVQDIDWIRLFNEHGLGAYVEKLREEWIADFDFVLIDSRTGITDIGGVCTIHLPDVLVLLFSANWQSLRGVIEVMHRARSRHGGLPFDRARLLGVPVPTRFENLTEYQLAVKWKGIFANELAEIYDDWLPAGVKPGDVLEKLFIPYVPYWSFGEPLPVVEEGTSDPRSLGFSYELLARLLNSRLQWSEVLQDSVAISKELTPTIINQEAETAFAKLSPNDQLVARRVFYRLVRVAPPQEGDDSRRRVPLTEFGAEVRPIVKALTDARLLVIERDDTTEEETVEIAQESLLRNWERLKDWLVSDREFLLWRQRLGDLLSDWQRTKGDKETLLKGILLDEAKRRLRERLEDLSEQEQNFIRHSDAVTTWRKRWITAAAIFVTVTTLAILGWRLWHDRPKSQINKILSQSPNLVEAAATTINVPGYEAVASLLRTLILLKGPNDALDAARKIENSHIRFEILVRVTEALVKADRTDEARLVANEARMIEDAYSRFRGLVRVAEAFAKAGKADEARLVANEALDAAHKKESPHSRSEVLVEVAEAMVYANKLDEAKQVANEAFNVERRSKVMAKIVETLAKVNRTDEALNLARKIEVASYRSQALTSVVEALTKANKINEVKKVATEALNEARKIGSEDDLVEELVRVAEALAKASKTDEAALVANEAIDAVRKVRPAVRPADYRALALARVAMALANANRTNEVKQVANEAFNVAREAGYYYPSALVRLVEALAKVNRTDEALDLARKIEDASYRSQALVSVAEAMAKNREVDKAKSAIDEAQRTAEQVFGYLDKSTALANVARGLAELHYYRLARELVDQNNVLPQDKLAAYATILREYHLEHHPDQAQLFAEEKQKED